MVRYLLVLFGGGAGALARYLAAAAIEQRFGAAFPWGTFAINISGSFAIGLLMAIFTGRLVHPYWRLVLVVGFLGGYTTFSSFEYETFQAMHGGFRWIALLNVLGSVGCGYVAVWLGALIGARH